ncbi:MAG: glyoxylate/hydroxypyruvate reductase A [Paracoccaceae bacterium]|nr:glyoxylate/hydroxypyruvate reductase A [Paracoccaceae bacterium]MDE2915108.1 glyoxylate/hydroxypyruvate reductase A [Paracoccaceae bacterium]
MTARVLFAAAEADWPRYRRHLESGFQAAGLDIDLTPHAADRPETVDYLIYAPGGTVSELGPFRGLRLVQSLWAGVETILNDPALTAPLARMVDPGMIQGMAEYVTGHVLRYHLHTDRLDRTDPGDWRKDLLAPLAATRRVGVLGAGVLGTAAVRMLAGIGFDVAAWSRTPKQIEGVRCHFGPDGLRTVLRSSQILVLMLPQTPATANLINRNTLALLPPGAAIINPSRGQLIDDDALLEALESGQVSGATLDVFRTEPLPASHPYWTRPNVFVTPHIAAETHPETASRVAVENIRRGERGEPYLHLVDRARGY